MKRDKEEIIAEALTAYQKAVRKKGIAVLKKVRGEDAPAKEKDPNQPTQADWYKLKKERFERQKQQELENKRKQAEAEKAQRVSGYKEKAAQSIGGIETQQISKDDPEGTAYKKLVGNVGSAAAGVAGGIGYGIAALAASRKKIEEPTSKQSELKEPGKPGRPKIIKPSTPPAPTQERGGAIVKSPSGALTKPPTSPTVDKRRMLPPSTQGGTRVGQPVRTVGQPAPQRPALPYGIDKSKMLPASTQGGTRVGQPAPGTRPQIPGSQKKAAIKAGTYKPIKSVGEKFSNWKQELIIEKNIIIEVSEKLANDKIKKKKIIDIFDGENGVEINPKIGNYFGYNESYDEGDETFRQHSRETFASHTPSETRKRTASVLKLMKQMNADVEKPKKKKKKKAIAEDCGCEKSDKKKDMMVALIKGLVNAKKKKNFQLNSGIIGESSPAWQRKEGKNPEGGLNRAGIASYRKEHPGSKLSLAVTTKPSKLKKGSKKAKRRKSFCSRMKGMKAKLTSAKTARDPNSRINKSLRKWNC